MYILQDKKDLVRDILSIFNNSFPQSFVKLCKEWEKKDLCMISNEETYTLGKNGILFLNTFLEKLILEF